MDDRLRALAASSGGYLHRGDILDCGETDRGIRRAVAEGVLVRIRWGTYAFADVWRLLDAEARERVVAWSVVDKLEPGSVALSHGSACAHHGIARYDSGPTRVHLTRLDAGAGRREAGVVHHVGRLRDAELVEDDGRLVVVPSRAVWETSTTTSQRGALVTMDSALHAGLITPEELREMARRHASWQGARRAALVARFADGGAESPGESLMRFLCFEHGLPAPSLQYEVYDENGELVARTDLGWEAWAHVGEFDGLIKYVRFLRPGESVSDAVVREKRREDKVRRTARGVSRTVWAEVQPSTARATALMIRRDLEQSRRLYLRDRTVIAL